MKSTSYKSYAELVESGELSKKNIAIVNAFKKHGAMTGRQVSQMIPGSWKRLATLQDMGLIEVVKTTKDHTTDKIVTVWAFCGNQPLLQAMPKVIHKKTRYKNNPEALSNLYDISFEAGVRHALAYICQGVVPEHMVSEILNVKY